MAAYKINSETFSNISSGVQSIAVTIGLIIGGWWALQTFIFQNPAFYERGSQVAGIEPDSIKAEISLKALDAAEGHYEATLTISNNSKTHAQVLRTESATLTLMRSGSPAKSEIQFQSANQSDVIARIPAQENREIHFLLQFAEPGVYLVENNVCAIFGETCLAQRYVSVRDLKPGSQTH